MKKIISFSLWGQDPKYLVGALKNVDLAKEIYPDWVCRFFCAQSAPPYFVNQLLNKKNVELVMIPEWGDWKGLYWRFYPFSDPEVDVTIIRDTDGRLSHREKAAVDEWLESDKVMHIMRDHPYHRYDVMPGMFGLKTGAIGDIKALIDDFAVSDKYGTDYEFWSTVGLPAVGVENALIHDEIFAKRPFPTKRNGLEFVGKCYDENDIITEVEHEISLAAAIKNK